MDIFAHGLWSFAVFHRKKYKWLAALFGILPDILSFGVLFIIYLLTGSIPRGPPQLNTIPKLIFSAYNITHSFIVFILVFVLIYIFTKKWFWPLTAWAIHILIDIPTHSFRFFPTPFLWPISNYMVDGISWATPWFMVLNYSGLLIVFILIAHSRAKEKNKRK